MPKKKSAERVAGKPYVPATLQEAITYFADPERAFQYAVTRRWPDGNISCPFCGSMEQTVIKGRQKWRCHGCKKQFSVKIGTIFEDSPISLSKWYTAVWMLVNCKNGISSYELHRALGVTQKTAWFMLHRVRAAIKAKSFDKKLVGIIEADETFIGGKLKNMHKAKRERINPGGRSRGGVGKTIVHHCCPN